MAISLEECGSSEQRTELRLTGSLDLPGVQNVELRLTAMTAGRRRDAVVDVSRVDAISSLGIGMLLSIASAMSGRGCRLVLVAPQPIVLEVLRRTRVDGIIRIVADAASVHEALRPA
jgi:anti-anti-sigma factor